MLLYYWMEHKFSKSFTVFARVLAALFFYKNLPSKIGVRLIHGIFFPFDDWAHDAGIVCCETPSRDR
jgi:hypothetical protein